MSLMMTVKQAAEELAISEQSIRKYYNLYRIGRSERVLRSDVRHDMRANLHAILKYDAGTFAMLRAFWAASTLLEHLDKTGDEDTIVCPTEAALLASTMAAFALEHPDQPVAGVDGVFPPTLAYVHKHLPQGGGAKGEALRAKLLEAA